MKITLLGSGDTLGTPIPACQCTTCQDGDSRSKRTRFALLIEEHGERILIDTNPDLRSQCVRENLRLETIDHVFITHTHSDHLNGMGEFSVRKKTPTHIYYQDHPITQKNIEYFHYLEGEGVLTFHAFDLSDHIHTNYLRVTPIPVNHGFPCVGFLIENENKKIGILTDTNHILPEITEKAIKNCDILFLDAFSEDYEQVAQLFSDIHEPLPANLPLVWGHMTFLQAIQKTQTSESRLGIALHISHYASPHRILIQKYASEYFQIGYDGMIF